MTITNFNSVSSYLPGVICKIVVKADLGRSTPHWIKNRWLEYCYTKCGRWTYFGQLIPLVLTSSHPEWQFHIATNIQWSRMEIPHCYWHLVVKNDNFTLLLTSSDQKWQVHIATDVYWSRMAIWHCYWHPVVKNGNFTLLVTSSGQEWQFHIATDI